MDYGLSSEDRENPPGGTSNGHDPEGSLLPLARRPDIELGGATIRPSVRLVVGRAGSITIEPRVMQVLLALADANGAVLTRDELMQSCWRGMIVGDDSVNRAIAEVRRVAREADAGFTVETIARVGYRLDVKQDEALVSVDGDPESSPARREPVLVSRRVLLGATAAVLSAGGIAFWVTRSSPSMTEAERLVEESRLALRANTPATDSQAISLLRKAVTIAPETASAWGLLALTMARTDEHAVAKAVSPTTEIERAARRALALDGGNADAQAALAIAIPYYGDWLGAERRFDAVLARHPDHVVTQGSRSFLLNAVGRIKEGAEARLAISGDASFDANVQYGQIYALWFLDRIEEADRLASRAMEMWPRNYGIWFGRLWLLADTGRFDRAIAHIGDDAGRPALPPPMIETLRAAMAAAQSRQPAEIAMVTERIIAGVGRSVSAVVNAMMLLNLMGATDRAFDLARAYYLEQGPIIAAMQWRPGQPVVPDQRRRKTNMLFTPTAAAMQRDPRFLPLMEAMGIADYWRKRGIAPDYQERRV